MASTINAVRGTSELKQLVFNHDPADATTPTKISWQPMKGFEWLMAAVMCTSAHALVSVKIFAATDGSGTNATEVVAHPDPSAADAVGDTVFVEVTAEQCKEVLKNFTHVSVEVDMGNSSGTAAVVYTFGGSHRKHAGLTADVIS